MRYAIEVVLPSLYRTWASFGQIQLEITHMLTEQVLYNQTKNKELLVLSAIILGHWRQHCLPITTAAIKYPLNQSHSQEWPGNETTPRVHWPPLLYMQYCHMILHNMHMWLHERWTLFKLTTTPEQGCLGWSRGGLEVWPIPTAPSASYLL